MASFNWNAFTISRLSKSAVMRHDDPMNLIDVAQWQRNPNPSNVSKCPCAKGHSWIRNMVHFGFNWLDLFVFMEQPLVPKYISQLLTCLFNTYYIVRAFFLFLWFLNSMPASCCWFSRMIFSQQQQQQQQQQVVQVERQERSWIWFFFLLIIINMCSKKIKIANVF